MKIILITIVFLTSNSLVFSQETFFDHCNCREILTQQAYKVISNGIEMESGEFKDDKRDGQWVSKNINSVVIRKATYVSGKLNGAYSLFYFDGTPKLTAEFDMGAPTGNWNYYNAKGKIIKQGHYENGKPAGIWKILNKTGKSTYAEYNFDTKTAIVTPAGSHYFQNGGILRDDQSGEWMVLYLPKRNINVATQPLGGYLLANDLFDLNFIVPTIFMNSYAQFEFNAFVKIENGSTSLTSVQLLKSNEQFDMTSHSFSFMVDTNSPRKLSQVEFSQASIDFLKDQVAEFVIINAPWITGQDNEEITVMVPIVINRINKR